MMAHNWIERDRKLTGRAKRRRQSGQFKDRDNRNKVTGKQKKLYNQIRRIKEDDETLYDEEGDYNGER